MQLSRISLLETSSSKELHLISSLYPYFGGIIGSFLNFLLIIGFLKRKNKSYQKYTLPICCAFLQLNLMAFVASNIKINSNENNMNTSRLLINYSSYTCKLLSFIIHVTSSQVTWIFSMSLYVVKCYLNRNKKRLEKMFLFYLVLAMSLCLIYSLDLFFLDLNTLSVLNQTQEIRVCSMKDTRLLLLRDLLDFLFYFLIPFVLLFYNAFQLRPFQKLKLYPKLKFVFQSFFLLIFAPNICVVLTNDFLMVLKNMNIEKNLALEWIFTLTIILNYSFILGATLMHAYFNTNTRLICYKIFCFPCFLVSILHEIESLEIDEMKRLFSDFR